MKNLTFTKTYIFFRIKIILLNYIENKKLLHVFHGKYQVPHIVCFSSENKEQNSSNLYDVFVWKVCVTGYLENMFQTVPFKVHTTKYSWSSDNLMIDSAGNIIIAKIVHIKRNVTNGNFPLMFF